MTTISIAKEVFQIESNAIKQLSKQLTQDFDNSISAIQSSRGKLIVSGMGKSGIIGKKIAATFASTGTPSFFLHPGEAYHGDLGMIEADDILLLISYSGETDEVLRLIPFLKEQNNTIISMSGDPTSTLATNSDFHLNIAVEKEACPLYLAPTSSTTATLVMGDALAVALMRAQNFDNEHFARFHPGGTLGRRLLTRVKDIMRTKNLPICQSNTSIKEIIAQITAGKLGLVVVMNGEEIQGVITDGDIRRAMEDYEDRFFQINASELLAKDPKTIDQSSKLTEASNMMTENKINSLLVTDSKENLVGIIQMYDLGI
ncbi:MAG TPA: KpsF/GutQ family sugar-phosphate isomerase [Sulfurovum sp.]|nr:KpsF/GutQ family sugar-phosphate isomerase [Sulfurovum sp.]